MSTGASSEKAFDPAIDIPLARSHEGIKGAPE
jgi:hypothetical protein